MHTSYQLVMQQASGTYLQMRAVACSSQPWSQETRFFRNALDACLKQRVQRSDNSEQWAKTEDMASIQAEAIHKPYMRHTTDSIATLGVAPHRAAAYQVQW